jgi:DNA-damage-inducible protein J
MTATTMVHVRLDLDVKAQATEALSAMGLSVSDAVRVFLTQAAMRESRKLMKVRQARFASVGALLDDLEKNGTQKNVGK